MITLFRISIEKRHNDMLNLVFLFDQYEYMKIFLYLNAKSTKYITFLMFLSCILFCLHEVVDRTIEARKKKKDFLLSADERRKK